MTDKKTGATFDDFLRAVNDEDRRASDEELQDVTRKLLDELEEYALVRQVYEAGGRIMYRRDDWPLIKRALDKRLIVLCQPSHHIIALTHEGRAIAEKIRDWPIG